MNGEDASGYTRLEGAERSVNKQKHVYLSFMFLLTGYKKSLYQLSRVHIVTTETNQE